jgi:hypothetical protein
LVFHDSTSPDKPEVSSSYASIDVEASRVNDVIWRCRQLPAKIKLSAGICCSFKGSESNKVIFLPPYELFSISDNKNPGVGSDILLNEAQGCNGSCHDIEDAMQEKKPGWKMS